MKHSLFVTTSLIALTATLPAQVTLQVDFGVDTQTTTATGWNNMTGGVGPNPADLTALVDSAGNPTLVDLTYTESGTNAGVSGAGANYGGTYPAAVAALPTSALQDGLYFQSGVEVTLTLHNLDPNATYDFLLYGARGNNGADCSYTVDGIPGSTGTGTITNVLNNSTETVAVAGISPTASGEITVLLTPLTNAASSSGALNLMTVTEMIPLDTDMDGMPDQYEDDNGLDKDFPGDADQGADDGLFDNDGLTNLEEYNGTGIADFDGGTDPNLADTDLDGVNDGDEVHGTLNPWNNGNPGPLPGESTDPLDDDSDDDGLKDGEELGNANGSVTDPNWFDTDLDNLPDPYEIANNLDPTDPLGNNGEFGDPDMDNLDNADEFGEGTDPQNPDSDGDTLEDGAEVYTHGTDPTLADSDGDLIDDNVELAGTTDPTTGDSDFDGYKDYIEIEAGSLPDDMASVPTFPAIAWSVQDLNTASALSTDGTLIYAENYNGEDATVNGILFTGRSSDLDEKSSPVLQTLLGNSADLDLYDNEVPELTPLLETFWWLTTVTDTQIGLTGLTPGKTYLVQFARADDRNDGNIVGRYAFADGLGGNTGTDPVGPTNTIYGGSANPALLFSGTFTATSSVQGFATGQYLSTGTLSGSAMAFLQVREIDPVADIIVTDVRRIGTTVEVDFAGLDTGINYQLVRSADLQDGFPAVVDGPRPPAGATDTYKDLDATDSEGFYQLEMAP